MKQRTQMHRSSRGPNFATALKQSEGTAQSETQPADPLPSAPSISPRFVSLLVFMILSQVYTPLALCWLRVDVTPHLPGVR